MVDAQLVKQLREITGVGILDCRKALSENGGDITTSIEWLRKKGIAKAASKIGRDTSQGLVAVSVSADKKQAAIIEINTETDFVSRNDKFQALVNTILGASMGADDMEGLLKTKLSSGNSVEDEIKNNI